MLNLISFLHSFLSLLMLQFCAQVQGWMVQVVQVELISDNLVRFDTHIKVGVVVYLLFHVPSLFTD